MEIVDITEIFETSTFAPFKNKTVRAINVPNCASKPKSFFENMLKYATEELEMMGLGYIKVTDEMEFLGPINKFIPDDQRDNLIKKAGLVPGCVLYFIADETNAAAKLAGQIRAELGRRLELIDNSEFKMCFIVDFPMYEIDEETVPIFSLIIRSLCRKADCRLCWRKSQPKYLLINTILFATASNFLPEL